ncbi:MAG: PilN domain-containing protein [bacterium]
MPDSNQINLIPADIIEERIIRNKLRKGIIYILGLILCFLAIGLNEHVYMRRLETEVSMLRKKNNRDKILEKEFLVNNKNIMALHEKKTRLLNLMDKSCLTPILLDLAKIINSNTKLTQCSIKKNTSDTAKESNAAMSMTIGGVSKSYQNLGDFLLFLQNQDSFEKVTLLKTNIDDNNKSYIHFTISTRYLPKRNTL